MRDTKPLSKLREHNPTDHTSTPLFWQVHHPRIAGSFPPALIGSDVACKGHSHVSFFTYLSTSGLIFIKKNLLRKSLDCHGLGGRHWQDEQKLGRLGFLYVDNRKKKRG